MNAVKNKIAALCASCAIVASSVAMSCSAGIDLSGSWRVEGVGVSGEIRLPGTLADAKLGQRWTREMFETTKDRPQSGALVREWQHLGEATYSRAFELSEAEAARPMELFLERVMWASRVEIDGRDLGGRDSLSTPHVYRVGKLSPGRHEIRVAVDNSCRYGFSRNSHSYGPSGQSVWHGVIGRIELRPVDPFASVKVFASAPSGGKVVVKGLPDGFVGTARVEELETASVSRDGDSLVLALASEPIYWSESTPRLYTLVLSDGDFERRIRFGFRTYGTTRHAVTVNGAKTFIRANIDNCLFPRLGRPPTDKGEWMDILRVLKEEDGFNAIRFHSWCPPEAAFDAADELGVYLQPEVCIWSDKWMKPVPQHVGWGDPVDGFVRREFKAICDAYANHPSFMSLAVGNELGGSNWDEAERIVREMRAYEPRSLHFFSSARTIVPSDQLTATHDIPGVGMCRERLFPNTDWDYEDVYAKASIPVIAHEIGQWPTYPDFAGLLPKFDGVMRPWNIDRCEARSRREGTDRFWREYMAASAHQSRLIYKDEVESFLRTPSCAGIHLLDAQDYTGEGEALMGWRDPFFALKPAYRDMKPFRSAWAREAALARIVKYDWCVGETFEARLQVRNQSASSIAAGREFEWSIVDCSNGSTAARGAFRLPREIAPGELGEVGTVRFPVSHSCAAKLELRFGENSWPFWAFPNEGKAAVPDGVTATDDFSTMREMLSRGGTVLYTGRSRETAEDSFKPVYWSSVWFPTKQPLKETLGTWFEKDHPMLAGFPTEEYSDWQWYGLVNGATIHRLTGLPQTFRPVALSVNDFHFSMLASSLFELKVGAGRLVVCGYDLDSDAPAARRLRASLFEYLSRPPAEGTAEVPLSWLDGFAPLAADGSAASEVVYSEDVDFCGKVFERDVKLSEPVTGFFELAFGATERECSGRGSVDGHSFDIPKGREGRVVRVGIIREDMLDGRLSVRFESADDALLRLTSLRVVR